MRAPDAAWRFAGKGTGIALLVLALLLQVGSAGYGMLHMPSLAMDMAGVACAGHSDIASIPDDDGHAPVVPHNLCCTLFCGTGSLLPLSLPTTVESALPPPEVLSFIQWRSADQCAHPPQAHIRHGARAPPVLA